MSFLDVLLRQLFINEFIIGYIKTKSKQHLDQEAVIIDGNEKMHNIGGVQPVDKFKGSGVK